jgi:hypothetical protein
MESRKKCRRKEGVKSMRHPMTDERRQEIRSRLIDQGVKEFGEDDVNEMLESRGLATMEGDWSAEEEQEELVSGVTRLVNDYSDDELQELAEYEEEQEEEEKARMIQKLLELADEWDERQADQEGDHEEEI